MKTISLVFALLMGSICVFGQGPWDGTKGDITVSTTSTPITTTLRIISSDTAFKQFVVFVLYAPEDGSAVRTMILVSPLARIVDGKSTVNVPIPLPESEILWFSITEVIPGQSQAFGR